MFRKIATYSASLYGVTLLSSAISFLVTMVVARRIPREALGLYGFYVTIYAFLGMLVCSGLNQALVKLSGSHPEDRRDLTKLSLSIAAALAIVAWPAAVVASLYGAVAWTWGLAAMPFFVLTLMGASLFRSAFERKNEVRLQVAISILNSTLTISFVFLATPELARIHGDFLSIAIPGAVLAILFAARAGLRGPRDLFGALRTPAAKRTLAFAVPLSIAGAAFVAYSNAASLLIRGLIGLSALGEYYFALQLMLILEKPLEILASVVLAAFAQDPNITPDKHRRLVTFNLAVFPMVAAGVVFAAPLLLQTVDVLLRGAGGEPLMTKYANAPLYLALFALAVPFRCIEFLVSTLAIARGRPEVNRNTHVLTTSFALPTLAALVWYFGPWGAAAMPVVYQVIFLTLQAKQLRAEMPEIIAATTRSAILATFLMAGVLWVGTRPGAIWLYPVAACAYLALGQVAGAWDFRVFAPAQTVRAWIDARRSSAA